MSQFLLIFIFLSLGSSFGSANPRIRRGGFKSVKKDIELGYRLPNDTLPVRYDITITTNIHRGILNRFNFNGEVAIQLQATKETSQIVIHHRQLTILDAKLFIQDNGVALQEWQGSEIEYDKKYEFLTFQLTNPLNVGSIYTLHINYRGVLRNDEAGFYRSWYYGKNSTTVWMATTQFEATDARHGFPCYDEPGIRAVYGVTIIHGSGLRAITNTPVKSTKPDEMEGYTKTIFEDTPKMQTYLLAWVICDFEYIEIHGKVPQRVYATEEDIGEGLADYGVRVGVDVLNSLSTYFQVNYQDYIPKIDQIGIPDFSAGAMENWGLVTYAEYFLLFEKEFDSLDDKHDIAETIAHEYTHQFFGNLVSPTWWDHLWLNEGFASLYQNLVLMELYPEFNDAELFLLRTLQDVMEVDGYGITRPMDFYVESPEDIEELFDDIAYPKSASVLYTWRNAIGEVTWQKGLQHYLNKMKLQSATSKDLADSLQWAVEEDKVNIAGLNMVDIVENWSTTAGYPVIHVSLTNDNKLNISQAQFLYSPNSPRASPVWYIPISVATKSHPIFESDAVQFWLKTENEIVDLQWEANDWIVVNINQNGYYRVNYDSKLWDQIIDKLQSNSFEEIHHASRSGLVNDAFNLARAELLDYNTVFRLIEYLQHEKHFQPWVSAEAGLTYMHRLLLDTANGETFDKYIQHLVVPLLNHYNFRDNGDSENFGDKLARSTAINLACLSGEISCREQTKKMLEQVLSTNKDIANDLQEVVYCAGMRTIDALGFGNFSQRLQSSDNDWYRFRLAEALGCTENVVLQNVFLQSLIASGYKYSVEEGYYAIKSVYSNSREGIETAMEFLGDHAKDLRKYGYLDYHARNIARLISSETHMAAYTELLITYRGMALITEKQMEDNIAIAKLNLKWISENEGEIRDYFENFFKNSASPSIVSGLLITVTVIVSFFV